jgi:hypothetical protein
LEQIAMAVLSFIGEELIALMFQAYIPELILIVPGMMGFIQ